MKEYDIVMVLNDNYKSQGVTKGMCGKIFDPRLIDGKMLVYFSGDMVHDKDGVWGSTDIECVIKEKDLALIEEANPFMLEVEIIKINEELNRAGVRAGMRGIIREPSIDKNGWIVHFSFEGREITISVKGEFLKAIKNNTLN